jgi:hypothetical protein
MGIKNDPTLAYGTEKYWEGFEAGVESMEKEMKHQFSQWLLLLQEIMADGGKGDIAIAVDKKQKEMSGRA